MDAQNTNPNPDLGSMTPEQICNFFESMSPDQVSMYLTKNNIDPTRVVEVIKQKLNNTLEKNGIQKNPWDAHEEAKLLMRSVFDMNDFQLALMEIEKLCLDPNNYSLLSPYVSTGESVPVDFDQIFLSKGVVKFLFKYPHHSFFSIFRLFGCHFMTSKAIYYAVFSELLEDPTEISNGQFCIDFPRFCYSVTAPPATCESKITCYLTGINDVNSLVSIIEAAKKLEATHILMLKEEWSVDEINSIMKDSEIKILTPDELLKQKVPLGYLQHL